MVFGLIAQSVPALATPPVALIITPEAGPIGTEITIRAFKSPDGLFTKTGNRVNFTKDYPNGLENLVATVDSSDGVTLTFTVPDGMAPYCPPGQYCTLAFYQVLPGPYTVTVINSNEFKFVIGTLTVTSGKNQSPEPSPRPIIAPMKRCYDGILPILKPGSHGDEVKKVQEILGVTTPTGYFGPLTETKVKEVETKLGLPQTGVVDSDIWPFIYPCHQITVVSPNGGEIWDASKEMLRLIQWQAFINQDVKIGGKPPFLNTTIDLVQNEKLIRRLAEIETKNGINEFNWGIPIDIPSGKYKIRIGFTDQRMLFGGDGGKKIYPPAWQGTAWDESDADFEIVNAGEPTPTPTSKPISPIREQLQELLKLIEQMQNLLKRLLSGA